MLEAKSPEASASPADALAALFAGKPPREQQALLATLERSGAALYRALAAEAKDPSVRAELERAAEREEENARTLERLLG
ncbi:MAG TPA: hypothetical protein VIS07_04655 [Candidatus Binatia bacterium]